MATAVVTGGNRGIGFAVCEALRDKGFDVTAVIRDQTATAPPGVSVVNGDLSSKRTVTTLAKTCDVARFG